MGTATIADTTQNVIARIERIPFSGWHVKMRVIIGAATFFDALDAVMIATILPVLMREWHLRPDQIGFLISIGYIGQTAGAIFFGWLAERVGRVPSMIATIALYAVMSILSALSWSYWSLFLFRTIQGIGLGGEVPVAASYVNEFCKAKGRGRFFMLYEQIFLIGVVVSSLLGLIIVPRFGWRMMFWIGAIPALLALLLRWLVPESPRWLVNKGRIPEADKVVTKIEKAASRDGKVALPPVQAIPARVTEKRTDWRELFRGTYLKRTIVLWFIYFTTYFFLYGIGTWVPTLFVKIFKLPLQQGLRYNFYFACSSLVACIINAFVIDKIGRKMLFGFCLFAGGFVSIILWLTGAQSPNTVLVLGVFSYFWISSLGATLFLYGPELYPTRLRALGSSVGTSWQRLASATGPVAVGFIVGATSLKWAFLMFGLVPIVGGIITLLFGEETKGRVLEELSP